MKTLLIILSLLLPAASFAYDDDTERQLEIMNENLERQNEIAEKRVELEQERLEVDKKERSNLEINRIHEERAKMLDVPDDFEYPSK